MTPMTPERYKPRTYQDMQEQLSDALAEHITRRDISASAIKRRYDTIRSGHIRSLKTGDGHLHGLKLLLGIAEATGLKVSLRIET